MHKPATAFTQSSAPLPLDHRSTAHTVIRNCVFEATGVAMDVMGLPFDIARAQYARAVQLGLIERSMLASRDFSRVLGSLERMTLGPWARHV